MKENEVNMDNILKKTKIFFFFVWGLVGFFVLLFFMGLFIFNPLGRVEQGLKQLERMNQSNIGVNLQDKSKQVNPSSLSSVLGEKMKACFVSVLGEKRFSELDNNLGGITKDDQEKLIPCINQDFFTRQPFGVTGYTSVIISPAPTR